MRQFKWESKFLDFVSKYYCWIFIIVSTAASVWIRIRFLGAESLDMNIFLLPWYNEIKEGGGLMALNHQVGNYGILYQTLIALMTYLPIEPVAAYKIYSILCDYLMSVAVAGIVFGITQNKKQALISYVVVIMFPTVILNSSAWGQCDSMYALFCVLTVMCLLNKKYTFAFIAYGVAFALKLQAVFLLPFIIVLYLRQKEFSVVNLIWIPVTMIILSIGGILRGRSIFAFLDIYVQQVDTYARISNHYPTFWNFVMEDWSMSWYDELSVLCAFSAIVILSGGVFLLKRDRVYTKQQLLFLAFFLTFTAVFFMPNMHERYSYLYMILGIIVCFVDWKTIPAFIALTVVDMQTYAYFLFESGPMAWQMLVLINLAAWIYYFVRLRKVLNPAGTGEIVEAAV